MVGIAVATIDDSTAAMNIAIIDAANTRRRRGWGCATGFTCSWMVVWSGKVSRDTRAVRGLSMRGH
jgi:hypothetical protein